MEIGKKYIVGRERSDGTEWMEAICAKPSDKSDTREKVMYHAYCGYASDNKTVGTPCDEIRHYDRYIDLHTADIQHLKNRPCNTTSLSTAAHCPMG
jgi:hypothetical protein